VDASVALIIVALINSVGLILVAWMTNRTRSDVRKVEKATNSMKDALVAGARREGITQGRADEKASPTF